LLIQIVIEVAFSLDRAPPQRKHRSVQSVEGEANLEGENSANDFILVVEDDVFFAELLRSQVGSAGYRAELAFSAAEGLRRAMGDPAPTLVLLDYHLGDGESTGLDLCKLIKSERDLPVIMLTGNSHVATMVACLDSGADQYIVKPCSSEELLARIRAVRRLYRKVAVPIGEDHVVSRDGLRLDTSAWEFAVDGATVKLTELECRAAEQLLQSLGADVARQDLYWIIYGREYNPMNRSIDMLIGRLRKKLSKATEKCAIIPVRSKGYRMVLTSQPQQEDGNI